MWDDNFTRAASSQEDVSRAAGSCGVGSRRCSHPRMMVVDFDDVGTPECRCRALRGSASIPQVPVDRFLASDAFVAEDHADREHDDAGWRFFRGTSWPRICQMTPNQMISLEISLASSALKGARGAYGHLPQGAGRGPRSTARRERASIECHRTRSPRRLVDDQQRRRWNASGRLTCPLCRRRPEITPSRRCTGRA